MEHEGEQAEKDGCGCFQISSLRWRYLSKQIEGDFPNYRQVVPAVKDAQTVLEIDEADTKLIIDTLDKLPCTDRVNFGIGVEIIGRKLELVAGAADGGITDQSPNRRSEGEREGREAGAEPSVPRTGPELWSLNVHIIDEMTPLRFSNGGRLMVIMPVRADTGPTVQPRAPESRHGEANPDGNSATDQQPASAPHQEAEASTQEKEPQMKVITPAAPATNGNGTHTEPAPTISTALEQIEKVRGSYREAMQGLTSLADTLKSVQREQKASDKEVQNVRSTLEKLQSVRL